MRLKTEKQKLKLFWIKMNNDGTGWKAEVDFFFY